MLLGGAGFSVGNEYVGTYAGIGIFSQSGGANTTEGSLYVGEYIDSSGTYNMSGGSLFGGNGLYVGFNGGAGKFIQTGGSVNEAVFLGSTSNYKLSGGLLNAGGDFTIVGDVGSIAALGTAMMNQSGGTCFVSGFLYIGYSCPGTYCLSGSGLLSGAPGGSEPLVVGIHSPGTFIQTGGTNAGRWWPWRWRRRVWCV